MNTTIVGSGMVGSALALAWAGRGHEVTVAVRNPDKPELADLGRADGVSLVALGPDSVAYADVVVLALTTTAAAEVAISLGGLAGKVVIDPTNPMSGGFGQLDYGTTTSSAERIAEAIPEARVVKAFNTIGASFFADPVIGGEAASMFIAGDDADSKAIVAELADSLGFDAVDCGPLVESRSLEAMALLWIRMTYVQQAGDIAFRLIRG
ncbi:MAG: NADPH-dependent F420 reductase [Microthrixaceae bacterium]